MNGCIYVVYGMNARREFVASIASLWQYNDLEVAVIGQECPDIDGVRFIEFQDNSRGARWAKLHIDQLSPWDQTLYLDADTRIHGDLTDGFKMLDDGWDMVLAPSRHQGEACMQHISAEERNITLQELGNPFPLQLQAGVMFFNNLRCCALFDAWRGEWQRWKEQDQAALLRALDLAQVRIHILGHDWNGGTMIEHLFGRAR